MFHEKPCAISHKKNECFLIQMRWDISSLSYKYTDLLTSDVPKKHLIPSVLDILNVTL